jgi:hypothetical protein
MQHSFDISIAEKYGVNTAIFLNHLAFWINKNQANNKHFHDGRYWTYNTVQAYSVLFPYWTPKQMRTVLDKVKESGLVLTGNYNATPYDRTQWYSLSDEGHALLGLPICPSRQMELSNRANGFGEKGKPIPDNKTRYKNKEREPARKKRAPLSVDYQPHEKLNALIDKTIQRSGHPRSILLTKFRNIISSSNKQSADWDAEFENFLLNEKSVTSQGKSAKLNEPYSAVNKMPEWVSEKNIIKPALKGISNDKPESIMQSVPGTTSEVSRNNARGGSLRKVKDYLPQRLRME